MLRLRGIHAVWLLCLCGYGLVGCADTTSQATPEAPVPAGSVTKAPLKKVRLLLNWFPEPEHGGFYAAQVHGFYAAEGLDVEILPGGPNSPVASVIVWGAT